MSRSPFRELGDEPFAAREIRVHNERLRARREEMAQLRVDLLAKVQRLRAILGEPLS